MYESLAVKVIQSKSCSPAYFCYETNTHLLAPNSNTLNTELFVHRPGTELKVTPKGPHITPGDLIASATKVECPEAREACLPGSIEIM